MVIDIQGTASMKNRSDFKSYAVFLKPPSFEVLEYRLRRRKTESEQAIQKRLQNAKKEIEIADRNQGHLFDAFIVNDDLDRAVNELRDIVTSYFKLD
jgi:guanylate kinase